MSSGSDADDLAEGLATIIMHLYKKSRECDCSECRPKPPPQAVIPDSAALIYSLLRTKGLNMLEPIAVRPPSNTVTIFAGQYAGRFGVVHKGQFSHCSCCVLVLTTYGVVKVSREHCNVHR